MGRCVGVWMWLCSLCLYWNAAGKGGAKVGVVGKPSEGGVGEEADAGEGGEGAQTTGEHLEQLRSPFEAWLVFARITA